MLCGRRHRSGRHLREGDLSVGGSKKEKEEEEEEEKKNDQFSGSLPIGCGGRGVIAPAVFFLSLNLPNFAEFLFRALG
jgi:hypothetical protein